MPIFIYNLAYITYIYICIYIIINKLYLANAIKNPLKLTNCLRSTQILATNSTKSR